MKKSNVFYMQTKPCPFTAYIEQRAEYDFKNNTINNGYVEDTEEYLTYANKIQQLTEEIEQ